MGSRLPPRPWAENLGHLAVSHFYTSNIPSAGAPLAIQASVRAAQPLSGLEEREQPRAPPSSVSPTANWRQWCSPTCHRRIRKTERSPVPGRPAHHPNVCTEPWWQRSHTGVPQPLPVFLFMGHGVVRTAL